MKKIIKYRNLFVFLALTLICTFSFSFTGCSGSKNDTIFGYMGNGSNAGPGESNSTADYNRQQQSYSSDAEYSMLSADGSTPSSQMVERKIIRDANITMEVEDIEKSYDNILAALAQYNGYEAGRDMNTDSGGSPRIGATLKIPADKLDTFMGDIQKEGKLISSSISSSDITDQYYDSQTRLTNLEKTLDKYYEFLANAKTVDEQLQVTNYINDLTTQIEQLKGSLQRWDSQVSYSTVTLSLYRPYEAPKPERVIKWSSLSLGDMGWLISSGFVKVCNGIFSVIQWILISVVTVLPVLIPLAVVIFFLVRHNKKKKKQKSSQIQAETQIMPTSDVTTKSENN